MIVLTQITNGSFGVAMNREHFKEMMNQKVDPQPVNKHNKVGRQWIQMGFPNKKLQHFPSLCAWLLSYFYLFFHFIYFFFLYLN